MTESGPAGQSSIQTNFGAIAIAAGALHSLALLHDGTVRAWGSLAWGNQGSSALYVPGGLTDVVAIAAGDGHSAALRSDGRVVTWSDEGAGPVDAPAEVGDIVAISSTDNHNLALRRDGSVYAWHQGATTVDPMPPGITGMVAISDGRFSALGVREDGTVITWGRDGKRRSVPRDLVGVVDATADAMAHVAIREDGKVVTWDPRTGEPRAYATFAMPGDVSFVERSDLTAIDAYSGHVLGLTAGGSVTAWGSNSRGRATPPERLDNVVAVAAGGYHSLALTSDGMVTAWGDPQHGQVDVPADIRSPHCVDPQELAWGARLGTVLDRTHRKFIGQRTLDLENE